MPMMKWWRLGIQGTYHGENIPIAVCKLVTRRGISISGDWIDEHGATLLHVAPSSRTSFIPTKDINAELSSERLHGHCGQPVCLAWSFPALWTFKKIREATRCERTTLISAFFQVATLPTRVTALAHQKHDDHNSDSRLPLTDRPAEHRYSTPLHLPLLITQPNCPSANLRSTRRHSPVDVGTRHELT